MQSFQGYANFYQGFIAGFSALAQPLICLSLEDMKLDQSPAPLTLFESLKAAFRSNTILAHFNPNLEPVVETEASDFVFAGVLS
jgi:hypothetical protein